MNAPDIQNLPDGYLFTWPDAHLQANVQQLRQHRDQRLTADVQFFVNHDSNAAKPLSAIETLSLKAHTTKDSWAKRFKEIYPSVDWFEVIEQLCQGAMRRFLEGEPVVELNSWDDAPEPKYLLYPFVPQGHATIIYGDGGSFKSLFSLVLSLTALMPWTDNPLGIVAPPNPCRTLYLDYEFGQDDTHWRWNALSKGFDLDSTTLSYRRCALPLKDEIAQIIAHIYKTEASIVVIDALDGAAGGELKETAAAQDFYAALRRFPSHVTPIIIAHNPKDHENKTVLGSTLFTTRARSVWEAKGSSEGSSGVIALYHRKYNRQKMDSKAFQFVFSDSLITCSITDPLSVPSLEVHEPLWKRIQRILERGSLSTDQLKAELGFSSRSKEAASVAPTLSRYKQNFQWNGSVWSLLH